MKKVRPNLINRLIDRYFGITADSVLNTGPAPDSTGISVAAELKRHINAIKSLAFNQDAVDYKTLKDSDTYREYRLCTHSLQTFDPTTLSPHQERLAFWINIYNSLIIDAVLTFDIQSSVREDSGFFWRAAYNINGHRFNSFDIEYGILRANAGSPAIPGPQFPAGDPRRAYSLQTLDPRIHFTLVCAAHSCPPIAAYDAERIDDQLDLAARAFINNGGARIDPANKRAILSRIFQWYAPDFGSRPFAYGNRKALLYYVAPYG